MKIVFEINHPAQAHLFRNVIRKLNEEGNQISVLIKDNKVVSNILDDSGISWISLGEKGRGILSKAARQINYISRIRKLYKQHQFDLGVGVSVSLPLFSRISKMKSIVLDDDDKKATPLFAMLSHKNASALLRPDALSHEGNNRNVIYYKGIHELAYLHPDVFKADISVLKEQGLKPGEPFFILRLVAFKAHHDMGISGIDKVLAEKIVNSLRPYGRVVVTSEMKASEINGTEPLRIQPSRLHHLLAFSKIVVTDGQTLCSEAACLGVPSVRINDFVGRISTLENLQSKWQLTFGYRPLESSAALVKIASLANEDLSFYKNQRDKMIADSINVRDFLAWFIRDFPASMKILKTDPGYQLKFK